MTISKKRIILAIIITFVFAYIFIRQYQNYLEVNNTYQTIQTDFYFTLRSGSLMYLKSLIMLYMVLLISIDNLLVVFDVHYKNKIYHILIFILALIIASILYGIIIHNRYDLSYVELFNVLLIAIMCLTIIITIYIKSYQYKIFH